MNDFPDEIFEADVFEFGPFSLNPREPSLRQAGQTAQPITLPPKVFELLKLLLENSGQILDKDTLMQRLWPDCIVEESSLTQLVFQLRKTLGESAARQQYIETIPRRGYRFIAEVRQIQSGSHEVVMRSRTDTHIVIEEELAVPAAAPVAYQAATTTRVKTRWLAVAASLALAAAGFGVWRTYQNQSRAPRFAGFTQRELTTSGNATQPALSPNAKWVAYVAQDNSKQSLWVQPTNAGERLQVVAPAVQTIVGATFSPDNQWLYFVSLPQGEQITTLYQVPLIGGTPRAVLRDVDTPISFAPNGDQFAFIRNDLKTGETALMIAHSDGTQERALVKRQRPNNFLLFGPAWSPDGRTIACSARNAAAPLAYTHLVAVNVANGEERAFGERTWTSVGQAAWLKDGSGLIASAWHLTSPVYAEQLWFVSWPTGAVQQITSDLISREGVSVAAQADALVTGRSDRVSRLWLMPNGKTPKSNTDAARPLQTARGDNHSENFGLDWTPDGKLVYGSHANGNADVYEISADGAQQRQLTATARREVWPVVSADGKVMVFCAQGDEPQHIWRVNRDGTDLRQLTFGKGEGYPTLSPDGRWVVYPSAEAGQANLWKVSLEGGQPTRLTQHPTASPAISPDGRFIACLYRPDPNKPIVVALLPFDGGAPVKTFDQMPVPQWRLLKWTPDGSALTYIVTRDGVSNLWAQPVDGGAPRQLTEFKEDLIYRFAWSRDGQWLALDRGITVKDIIWLSDFR